MRDLNYLVRDELNGIVDYKPGKTTRSKDAVRISANENCFGTSSGITRRLIELAGDDEMFARYPDIIDEQVVKALSGRHGYDEDHFITGNGLDDIITILAMTFISKGCEVVVPTATFGVYANTSSIMGAKVVRVPLTSDLAIDVSAMIAAISERTRVVWLCSPNNPTGTVIDGKGFEEIISAVNKMDRPPLIVVDQAYVDFADEDLYSADRFIKECPTLIVLRTLSKLAGLAGLRFGYAIADPQIIKYMYRVRPPYTVNTMACAAALCYLTDAETTIPDTKKRRSLILAERDVLEKYLADRGIANVRSHANFVFAFCDKSWDEISRIADELEKRNIYVRRLRHTDAPDGIRFSIGTPDENAKLIKALDEIV